MTKVLGGSICLSVDSRALSYSDPYCQSACLSFCLSVCPHFQNASSPAVLVGIS